ncbi:MAG: hypothetical protein FWE82_04295 [Defluviitaleaceae bacterium]|nr:hypothetical protein [Defluviitaleaceae bacterium]
MPEQKIEAYLPAAPRSIFLEKQIKAALEGKIIIETSWEKYFTGKYSWHGDHIEGFDKLPSHTVIFADASFVLTDKGALISFGCMDGGLRFFQKDETVSLPKISKSESHGYHAKIFFGDGSCCGFVLYGWATMFKLYDVNINRVDKSKISKSEKFPFLPKPPIDVNDDEDFTLENFRKWLSINPGANIIENCATAKGAFKIDNPMMNYLLLVSKIHPRTKTRALDDDEIKILFENTKQLVNEYKSGTRVCDHTDIYGKTEPAHNDITRMTAAVLGKPCPICGASVDATPAAGSKMYFCPNCQKIKK